VVAGVESFDEFVLARGTALLRFAYLLTRDAGRAEDLVQDALLKTHRRWDAVVRADRPDAYVRRIVVNDFLSWRRRPSSRETTRAVPETTVPDASDQLAERDLLWRALAMLPLRQRAVLVLRYYEDLTDPQIADALGCATGTVRSLSSRALAALRAAPTWAGDAPTAVTVEEP
jgi:RNA polymerase sigma-70 factor (sigma-E family)